MHPRFPAGAGDVEGAARLADAARRMDLADRYLNCNAVKALFRAGHVSAGRGGTAAAAAALSGRREAAVPILPCCRLAAPRPLAAAPRLEGARKQRRRSRVRTLLFCANMQMERAEATAALFTRDGEQTNNLFDMQVGAGPV